MKEETLRKMAELADMIPDQESVDKYVEQSNTTIELAKRCDMHPVIHSFLELYQIRNRIIKGSGDQSDGLYSAGNDLKFTVDSVFDEIIDEVVENLGACPCKITP